MRLTSFEEHELEEAQILKGVIRINLRHFLSSEVDVSRMPLAFEESRKLLKVFIR